MSEAIDLTKPDAYQPPRLPEQPISPADPLRWDFIGECFSHVARISDMGQQAAYRGDSRLVRAQIELMRVTMREVVRTFEEVEAR
jgi:hypothetical protein